MDTSADIVIDAPIDRVFGYITDVTRMPIWVTGVTGARMVSDRMGEGARFVVDYQPGRRETELEVVVEGYQPPVLFATKTARGPFAFSGRIELERTDTGTRVTSVIQADPDSLSTKVANLVIGGYIRRSMVRRLAGELAALGAAIASDPGVRR